MADRKSPSRSGKSRRSATSARKAGPRKVVRAADRPPARGNRPPIIGIGASAGGLEAMQELFRTIPPDPGVALIVVQHLDPTRGTELPALLARASHLPVVAAEDGALIEANRVYTIPPDRYLSVEGGRIRVTRPSEPRGQRLPVDVLFHSLAQDAGESAIGIVLSGNGADGSLGLRSIKGQGGLTVVQDPSTAGYNPMPRNAIATGVVDFILPPSGMMDAILGIVGHNHGRGGRRPRPDGKRSGDIQAILTLLHSRRNVDFSGYKTGTLGRRIARRMGLKQIRESAEYLGLLLDDPEEINALFDDLLIQVTRFFREPESWTVLRDEVLQRLIDESGGDHPIRVWVPGCATGEEAYSIAMLLHELAGKSRKSPTIQVFASDLDRASLNYARAGVFPGSIAADVSAERLARFFAPQQDHYSVSQQLRDTVIFSHHNLLVDPPFSRLDLISCRNVLIYLEARVQQLVLDRFHFALKPGKFLVLGSSETIGSQIDLFEPAAGPARIYRRLGAVRPDRHRFMRPDPSDPAPLPSPAPSIPRDSSALVRARDQVLERHTAACALVNRRMEILSLFGPTRDFLHQPTGALTADILAWVREGVRTRLRAAVQSAIRKNEPVTVRGLRLQRGDSAVTAAVTVEPLAVASEADGLLLVVFRPEAVEVRSKRRRDDERDEPLVSRLEYELKVARDELQAAVEQLESSNEELRATNEEVLAMNQELQATNQELVTSKEELQSINEELSTVNYELEQKILELQTLNDDVNNLLASTNLPALFLDRQFLIRRYTPTMTRLFRIIPADIGRPIGDIAHLADDEHLMADARDVLQLLQPVDREVRLGDHQGFYRQILPYRTEDDRIEGVVVTYTDISDRIQADRAVRDSRDFAEAVVRTLREPLLVLDERQTVRSANPAFLLAFRLEPEQVVGHRIYDIGVGEWNMPEFRRLLEGILPQQTEIRDFEIRRQFTGLGERVMCLNARVLKIADQALILLAVEDITLRIEAERARNEVLRQLVNAEERERHRLALELHDETGQHLTAFLLGLATLRESRAGQAESLALIDELKERAEDLAHHLHGIALQLRPTALDDHGLERALTNYVEDLSLRHGLEIDLHTEKSASRLPRAIETVLYRVTQEALTNVLRHAGSSRVSVVLRRKKSEVRLIVEDNGKGFRPDAVWAESVDGNHLGLRGMRERVMLAGGSLTVESEPGAGTTLFARIPLTSHTDGDSQE